MFSLFKKTAKKSAPGSAQKSAIFEESVDGISLKYKKHHASKRVKISIRERLPVLVTLPKRMSFLRAQGFVRAQIEWIKENTEKFSCAQSPLEETEKKREIKLLRKDAKEYLPKKVEELAQKHGFKYRKVSIKAMRTRWGSCSYFNNINLNLSLMKLEEKLVEYVILHELCHTVEKNHSPKFWALLEKHLPHCKELRRKLKQTKVLI